MEVIHGLISLLFLILINKVKENMTNSKKNKFIYIIGLAVCAGLAISSAIIGFNYEKYKQEQYVKCIETSANILVNDGNIPSNKIMQVAKEACSDYNKSEQNSAITLAEIAIFLLFVTFIIYIIFISLK